MKWLKIHQKEIKILVISIIAMGMICLLLYQPMMNLFKDPQVLSKQLRSYGVLGKLLLSGIMMLQVVFVFLPGEIVEISAGFIYGPWEGLFLCLLGAALGSIVIYIGVQKIGLPFIQHFFKEQDIQKLYFLKETPHLERLVFILFFIPGTPKDILTYFIPMTSMKLTTFLWLSSIARIPSVITSTLGGDTLYAKDYVVSSFIFILTAIISVIGLIFYRKIIQKHQHL